MRIIFTALVIFFVSHTAFSQKKITDSTCSCIVTGTLHSVSVPEPEEKNGTVIVEFDVDSIGICSNAIVIQSLGPEYDKEALRCVNEILNKTNSCISQCRYHRIRPALKLRKPITFTTGE